MCDLDQDDLGELLMDDYFFRKYVEFWLRDLHALLNKDIEEVIPK